MRTQNLQKTATRKARFGREQAIGKPLVFTAPSTPYTSASGGADGAQVAGAGASAGAGAGAGGGAGGRGALPRPDGVRGVESSAQVYPDTVGFGAGIDNSGSGNPDNAFSPVEAQALAPRRAYLEARASDMHSIQQHIVELGQIFNRLGLMVSQQAELVQRLEDNADMSLSNVEAGTSQLTKKLASVSSNKMLALKIFAILVVFAVFFSVFLA
mgnify:CR=1 FL=1